MKILNSNKVKSLIYPNFDFQQVCFMTAFVDVNGGISFLN